MWDFCYSVSETRLIDLGQDFAPSLCSYHYRQRPQRSRTARRLSDAGRPNRVREACHHFQSIVLPTAALPNISIAISLDTILVPQPWQLGFLYGIPMLQCTIALICSIITYTECLPLEGLWNEMIPHKCLPEEAIVGILFFNGGGQL